MPRHNDKNGVVHHYEFAHNRITGLYRAQCSCGWLLITTSLDDASKQASVHDIDQWEPIEVADA